MSASDIGVEAIVIPNPRYNPATEYAQIVNSTLGFEYNDANELRTLSSNNPSDTNLVKGLLYIPSLSANDGCDNTTRSLIPTNVTRLSDFPSNDYPLVALAPWTSRQCVLSFMNQMNVDDVNGAIFFHPGNEPGQPPPTNDPSWDLHDGGKWMSLPFPIYAVSGPVGTYLINGLAEYSGAMINCPKGNQLVKQYDSRNFVRLYAQLDVNQSTNIPSLWVFLIIVLAILLAVVLFTSVIMHFVQARHRRALQRRVARGEVDLEALGVKRLNVPQSLLDKMPQYVYTTKGENAASPTTTTGVVASKAPVPANAHREVPFTQPTCAICLDDFVHNETIVRELPCSHIFHPECIDPFLRDNSSLCPLCKKSALPPGYCPIKVTNLMVRRERLIRRMRERAIAQAEEANGNIRPARRLSIAMSSLQDRVWGQSTTPLPQRSQAWTSGQPPGTELAMVQHVIQPPAAVAPAIDPAEAPPPEIERQGTSARRAWRRERLARAEQSNYEGLTRQLIASDDRPRWRRMVGRVLPGVG